MNPWIVYLCYFAFMILLLFILIGAIVQLKIRKRKQKSIKYAVVSIVTSIFLIFSLVLFIASHSTYYKYNDWAILVGNIHAVQNKYGDFDLGSIEDHKAGRVAYYIYTDNGPIMPDYLDHYYYIEYDVWGVVDKVYEAGHPGG